MCVYCHDLDRSHAINDETKKNSHLAYLDYGGKISSVYTTGGVFFLFNHTRIQPYVDYGGVLVNHFSRLPSRPGT